MWFNVIVSALCNLPRGESETFRSGPEPAVSVTATRVLMGINVDGVLFSDEDRAAATIQTALAGK